MTKLHFDTLKQKTVQETAHIIKKALESLPKGRNSLENIRYIPRADWGPRKDIPSSGRLTHTRQHLTTAKLVHALAADDGENLHEHDEYGIPDIRDLISGCEGLVDVDHNSQIVQQVHYKAKEYFSASQHF